MYMYVLSLTSVFCLVCIKLRILSNLADIYITTEQSLVKCGNYVAVHDTALYCKSVVVSTYVTFQCGGVRSNCSISWLYWCCKVINPYSRCIHVVCNMMWDLRSGV